MSNEPGYCDHGVIAGRACAPCAAKTPSDWAAQAKAVEAQAPTSGSPVEALREVFQFLSGAAAMDGAWFGERPTRESAPYWWRIKLRDAVEPFLRSAPPLEAPGEVEEALHCVDDPQDAEGNRIHYVPIEQARTLARHIRASRQGAGEPTIRRYMADDVFTGERKPTTAKDLEYAISDIENYEAGAGHLHHATSASVVLAAYRALLAATPSGAVQEPVAWEHRENGNILPADVVNECRLEYGDDEGAPIHGFTIPLYRAPSPASHGVREALAKAWRDVAEHPGIRIDVKNDEAASVWNALCQILDPLYASLGPDSSNQPKKGDDNA